MGNPIKDIKKSIDKCKATADQIKLTLDDVKKDVDGVKKNVDRIKGQAQQKSADLKVAMATIKGAGDNTKEIGNSFMLCLHEVKALFSMKEESTLTTSTSTYSESTGEHQPSLQSSSRY